MTDEERIEQLELEVKVLRDNNKGLKDKIDEQSKEIEEAEQKERKAYIKGTNDADELCNKKWEDKIKAKIEEINKEWNEIIEDKNRTLENKNICTFENNAMNKVLQELLEEE